MKPSLAQRLGDQGRGGDTLVAHITPHEALILKLLGGAGTRNPKTGLLEFDVSKGDGPSGGGGPQGAAGHGHSEGHGGNSGSKNGGAPAKGGLNSGVGSATAADAMVAKNMGLSPDTYSKLAGLVRDQVTDSYDDGLGGWLDRLFGLRETLDYDRALKATQQATQAGTEIDPTAGMASWGFDPAGLVGGLIGSAFGVPGLGLAAAQISNALGRPAEIGLGPDVFGGSGFGSTGSSAGSAPGTTGVTRGNGPGNLNDVIARIAAARNSNRAGAGVQPASPVAIAAPAVPVSPPGLPSGLFAYLAQNAGQLAGYSGSPRFGAGTVAPFTYLRPIA